MTTKEIADIITDKAYEIAVGIKVAERYINDKEIANKDIAKAVAYEHILKEIKGDAE